MSHSRDNLDQALRAASAGDLHTLRPEQVARLEAVLNDEPGVAARLADRRLAPDPQLARALAQADRAAAPAADTWEQVWERIDAAGRAAPLPGAQARARILRLWRPFAAAAACLLMAGLWRLGAVMPKRPWPLQMATEVEINELEVYDGATSFVVSTGGKDGFEIIWVLEGES